jgi:hypothetical protein
MGILDRFQKLVGKVEPISDREKWRRAVVRNGNLDWRGQPIDQNAGGPITSRPDPRYRSLVDGFLERTGLKIEARPNQHIPVAGRDQFGRDAAATQQAYDRRFENPRRIESNTDSLR